MQRTFDDLGTPLSEVTFCVLDLETTGGSAASCGITEIGAVKVRGGECLGTFQTLVNPGMAIPPEITVLTGITQAMVVPAPRIESVLPAFLEFCGDAVVVGHNVRFDVSFLDEALRRADRPPMPRPAIDTCALARRLVRDEVPNCRLSTLAERMRLDHRPSHRALDDALATVDLLHVLLERAAAWGVLGLDDLVALPRIEAHPQATKLRLTTRLPRSPGVYLFRDRLGRVLYVGKATNLRQRVRSYFSGDERRKVGPLLRELHTIDHRVCADPLEAAVLEVRLIHSHEPPYNRQSRTWRRYVYLKLTLDEAFPRLSIVRAVRPDGGVYLGPLPSNATARRVAEAIESVVPLRRCSTPIRARGAAPMGARGAVRDAPCSAAQLGVATCPCAGTISQADYAVIVEQAVHGLQAEPDVLLGPLRARMNALAALERFEEAADVRDRADALALALRRQRRYEALRRAGTVVFRLPGGSWAEVRDGLLARSWRAADECGDGGEPAAELPLAFDLPPPGPTERPGSVLAAEHADEVGCIAGFLDAEAGRVRLEHCDGELTSPLRALPTFTPRARVRLSRA